MPHAGEQVLDMSGRSYVDAIQEGRKTEHCDE